MISLEDMAYEVAEYEYLHMPVQYMLDAYTDQWQDNDDIHKAMRKAWRNIHREWTSKPETEIRKAYADLLGSDHYAL